MADLQVLTDFSLSLPIAIIVVEVAVVTARFYAKTKVSALLAMDDYLIIPALVRSTDAILTGANKCRHVVWASA